MSNCIIISIVYNRPSFISYQYNCLKKFITVPFEYIIFDNSDNSNNTDEFKNICTNLNINYIRIPQDIHTQSDPSSRAGRSLDYGLRYVYNDMGFRGILMISDSDLFLINEYNPIEKIGDFDIVGRSIENIYVNNELPSHPIIVNKLFYYSNQFMLINCKTFNYINDISFIPIIYNDILLDCGGRLYLFLKEREHIKHTYVPDISCNYYNTERIMNENMETDLKNYFINEMTLLRGNSFSEIFDNSFIHLKAGSNWMGHSYDIESGRENNLFSFLQKRIEKYNTK